MDLSVAQLHLSEDSLVFPSDTFHTTVTKEQKTRIVNQFKVSFFNDRVLYPYNANIQIDQGKDFIRAGFTGKYFFNYDETKDGLTARFFAGKFFYFTPNAFYSNPYIYRYYLNMSGPQGYQDYTYSDYFVGRNEQAGWQSQQIMERDGFLKVSTPLLGNPAGRTDDWLIALNLSGDIPHAVNPLNILPFKIPVQVFVDIGTNAEAWKDNPATGKFLYDAGFQLSVLKKAITVYVPVFYSKVYSDYYKSVYDTNRFWHTVSFSINLDVFRLKNLYPEIPL